VDFSAKLDELQQRAAEANAAAQAAASESREQLRQRIDQAKADVEQEASDARQDATAAAASAKSKWAEMKADATAKLDDFEAKMDRRADQRDAKLAARQADGAEADAADAIEFAAWTVDHARLAVLDAIDARAYADDLARSAGAQSSLRGGEFFIQHPAKEAATMGWDRRLPDPEWSEQGQFAAAADRGPGLLLPDGNGLVPWLLARPSGWQGPGSRRWSWTRWAGRVPVLRNPASCNRAVPLTYEQSRDGFANAAADHRRPAGPHRALALSIRAERRAA
jgi:hypothetical protein